MNKVAIIIVNYNNYKDTIECLESVLKADYTNFQIFVVDNSTTDDPITHFTDWVNNNGYTDINTCFEKLVLPLTNKPISHTIITGDDFLNSNNTFGDKITFIRTQNNGFAAANNIALKHLQKRANDASFIWILNNDTVVQHNTLTNLLRFYQQGENQKYITGAMLRNYYKPDTIQAAAGRYLTWLGKHIHIGEGEADAGQYAGYQPRKNDYVVGASMFLPLAFLKDTGLMNEAYFLYFEELDWIKAGAKKGYSVAVVPDAVVYHKEGASIAGNQQQKDTSMAEYYSITNRVRFIKKWHPAALLTVMPGVMFALAKRVAQGRSKLAAKAGAAVLKILFSGNPPVIKYKR